MEKFEYSCHYCGRSYVPNRRNIQRYCSDSCRVGDFNKRKKSKTEKGLEKPSGKEQTGKEKINLAGIGNAAIGSLATDLTREFFTKEENKPLTKKDFKEFNEKNDQRFFLIRNMAKDSRGRSPFFDKKNQKVFYSFIKK